MRRLARSRLTLGGEFRLNEKRQIKSNRPGRYQKKWLPPQLAAMAINVLRWGFERERGVQLPVRGKQPVTLSTVIGADRATIYRVADMRLDSDKERPKLHRVKTICRAGLRELTDPAITQFFESLLKLAVALDVETPSGFWELEFSDAPPGSFAYLRELCSRLDALPLIPGTRAKLERVLEDYSLLSEVERNAANESSRQFSEFDGSRGLRERAQMPPGASHHTIERGERSLYVLRPRHEAWTAMFGEDAVKILSGPLPA